MFPCVAKDGTLRIVPSQGLCRKIETQLSWPSSTGGGGPIVVDSLGQELGPLSGVVFSYQAAPGVTDHVNVLVSRSGFPLPLFRLSLATARARH